MDSLWIIWSLSIPILSRICMPGLVLEWCCSTWILVAVCCWCWWWWLLSCGSGVVNSWILGCCRLSGCWSSCILVCCCGGSCCWWLSSAAASWSWLSCGGSNSWIREEVCCWLLTNAAAISSLLWERLIRDTGGCWRFSEVISCWGWPLVWLKVAAGMDSGCGDCQPSVVGCMGSDSGTPHS